MKGVFQLESSGITELVVKLKPQNFKDVIPLIALYRPGPLGSGMVDDYISRKHGLTKVEYLLPELEELTAETLGVIVYQDQVLQIANRLAGYSLGEADLLRRAMGKKNSAEMVAGRVDSMGKIIAGGLIDGPNSLADLMYGNNEAIEKMLKATLRDPELVRSPGLVPTGPEPGGVLPFAELERRAIQDALAHTGGDKRLAAELLGISRAKIYQRLKEWSEEGEPEKGAG